MDEKEDPRQRTFRELAREQGELYLACYMEALRVADGIESIDAQNQADQGGPSVGEPPNNGETAEFEDADEVEEDEEVASSFVLGLAAELFCEAANRLRQLLAVPETPAETEIKPSTFQRPGRFSQKP